MSNITNSSRSSSKGFRLGSHLAIAASTLGLALMFSACKKGDSGSVVPTPTDGTTNGTNTGTPTDTPAPTPAEGTAVTRQSWIASWTSPSCGERKYTRNLSLADDGTVTGEDRVSPCPKGVQCVWSGIINISGTFELEGDTARMQLTPSAKQPKLPAALPAQLVWDSAAGGPAEVHGDTRCVYQRR